MRKSIKITLVSTLGAAIGFVSSALASDYFILPNEGNDSNDGKTPQTAWKTLGKLSRTIKGGDRGLLKGGQEYSGLLGTVNSGTQTEPIIFTSYGQGMAKIIAVGESPAIGLKNNQFLQFENLEVTSPKGKGISLSPYGDGSGNNTFRNVRITGRTEEGFKGANRKDHDITFQDCTIEKTGRSAIDFKGDGPLILRGNYIQGNIDLSGVQQLTLEGNLFDTQSYKVPALGKGAYTAKNNIWLVDKLSDEIFYWGTTRKSHMGFFSASGSKGDQAITPTMRKNNPALEKIIQAKMNPSAASQPATPYTPKTVEIPLTPNTPQTNTPSQIVMPEQPNTAFKLIPSTNGTYILAPIQSTQSNALPDRIPLPASALPSKGINQAYQNLPENHPIRKYGSRWNGFSPLQHRGMRVNRFITPLRLDRSSCLS